MHVFSFMRIAQKLADLKIVLLTGSFFSSFGIDLAIYVDMIGSGHMTYTVDKEAPSFVTFAGER